MIIRSRRRRAVPIPATTTTKAETKDYEFVKGLDTNSSNDDVDPNYLRYITDAREIEVGKWKTRQAADFFSVPIGEAVNVQQTSVTGASDFSFNTSTRWAKKITATATGPVTAIEANIQNADGATGTVVLALHEDDNGEPGDELFRTTIAGSAVEATYAYEKGRSITCPTITNTEVYWVVGYVQQGGSGSYEVSTTTNAATGLSSTNSGASWSAASLDFNVKVSSSTAGHTKGVKRVEKSDGASHTFLVHGTTLYEANESTGATTSIDTLNASTTDVRFDFVNDTLYYCDGFGRPRKHVPGSGTAAAIGGAPENASNVIEHKGLLFFVSADTQAKVFYSNFADYETFTSTDFLYVPAPKTGDPINALAKLNGLLFFITRNNKHVLFGADNATFRLDEAIGQKGTYSQESVAYDHNYIFLASDDGIYQFNGADEKNIADNNGKGILNEWMALNNKDSAVLELHGNRLYVFFTPNGGSENSECFVYNIGYGVWESLDTKAYVARTHSRFDPDDYFMIGSSRAGMVMLQERSTNDYCSMGEPLTYELHTHYNHYDAPAQFKRTPTFRPHFDTVSENYSVQVGYATDYSGDPTYTDVSLQGSGATFDDGYLFDNGVVFAGVTQSNPMDDAPAIPGEWRRLQLRYRHEAAREPVSFDGHILAIETQRLI